MSNDSANVKKVVTALSALLFFYGVYLGGVQLVIADISGEFGMTLSGIGILASAPQVTAVFFPAVIGPLADRIGKKKVIVIFSAVFGSGCLLGLASFGIAAYLLGALLVGAGYSVCESVSSAALSGLEEEKGSRYIVLSQGILSLGAMVSPLILPGMMRLLGMGWRTLFLICTVAFYVLGLIISRITFPARSDGNAQTQKDMGVKTNYFSSKLFSCMFAAIILYVGMEHGISYFAESLFEIELHRAELGPYGISAYWAGMTLSRFVYSLRQHKVLLSLMAFFAVSAMMLAAVAFCDHALFSVALCGAVGVAYGPIWSVLVALAAEEFPDRAAGATGLMSAGSALGALVFPVIVGVMSDLLSIRTAIAFLAVMAAAGLGLVAFGSRGRQPKTGTHGEHEPERLHFIKKRKTNRRKL